MTSKDCQMKAEAPGEPRDGEEKGLLERSETKAHVWVHLRLGPRRLHWEHGVGGSQV